MENEKCKKCKGEGRHRDGTTCKRCGGSGVYVQPKKGDEK